MKKRLFSTLLALCMVLALVPGIALAAIYVPTSGTCGDSLNWTLDLKGGILTISGSGQMRVSGNKGPWCNSTTSQKAITAVRFDGDISSIANGAFKGCDNLSDINIPSSVTSIGDQVFSGCKSLSNLVIPSSVTSIGVGAFQECENLTSMDIPASATSIGHSLYHKCINLADVNLPNSITSIGGSMFSGCSSLTSLEIPDSVTSIGSAAFNDCSSLVRLELPASITSIGYGAFEDCWNLTNVNIPASVTSIAERTFYYCKKLGSIVLPSDITSIGKQAFSACHSLTSIEIPTSVTSIGDYAFELCDGLKEINIPSSVTSIGKNAFASCTGLSSMTIPSAIGSIEEGLFRSCINLSSVNIPATVTSIGDKAFYLCKRLTDVYYDGSQKQWANIAIGTDNDPLFSAKIHCTDGITTTPKPDEGTPSDPGSHLNAPIISLTTSANIKEGTGSGVRWDAVDTAEIYYITVHNHTSGEYIYREQEFASTSFLLPANKLPAGTYSIWIYAQKTYNGVKVQSVPSNILTLTVTGQGSTDPDTPSKPPVVNPPEQPENPSIPGNNDMEFVKNLTKYSMGNLDATSQQSINNAIYNLLFKAQFRPDSTIRVSDVDFGNYDGSSQKQVNAAWTMRNSQKDKKGKTMLQGYVQDGALGRIGGFPASAGCMQYAYFAEKYIYGTHGSQTGEVTIKNTDESSFVKLLHENVDPGEHIRIQYYQGISPNNDGKFVKKYGWHSVVFLGEDATGEGFYCTDYADESGTDPSIRFNYWKYSDFVERYYTKSEKKINNNKKYYPSENEAEKPWVAFSVFNANGGAYANDTAKQPSKIVTRLECPVEATLSFNGERLNSSAVEDGDTQTVSFGSVSRSGSSITFTVDYREDYEFEIWGIGTGTMRLTQQYFSDDCLINSRTFEAVPINDTTRIYVSPFDYLGSYVLFINTGGNDGTMETWGAGINETVYAPNDAYSSENQDEGSDITTSIEAPLSSFVFVSATQGGTLTVSKHTAAPGDWVNIYATPNAGYRLDSLTATDHRGWPVAVREMGENAFSFTMPAARVTVNAVFTKAAEEVPFPTEDSSATGPDTAAGSPGYVDVILNPSPMNFTDVSAADWFYNDVRFCWQHYLMTGVSETRFDPQGATNRAMIWTVIARLAGRDTSGGSIWYERGQIWAKNKGITDGADPLADVTREQLVTMLWRFKGSPHVNTGNLLQFKDAAEVSGWAVQPVRWAVANGLLNGAFGSLNPQGKATRAEVAAILTRFCQFAG